jgi:DUF2075 family protein
MNRVNESFPIKALIELELQKIEEKRRRESLRSILIEPQMEYREWLYTPNTEYPCWVVATGNSAPVSLVYCEYGFGPTYPWGALLLGEDWGRHLGTDSQWFLSLDDAFINSGLWDSPLPDHYEVG